MTTDESLCEIATLPQDELAKKLLRIAEGLSFQDRNLVRAASALLHAKDELIGEKTEKIFALRQTLKERDERIREQDEALRAWAAAYPEAAE